MPERESKMGNTIKPKKATFLVSKDKNGHRIFTAVNKRAHTVAKKAGKRTKVTGADLKALKNTGTYKYYQYTTTGTLKAIQL